MKIYFENGSKSGSELEFAIPEITVGSEEDNVLSVPEIGVSRYHAVIRLTSSGAWLVRDLGSTNGVKVNQTKINGEQTLGEGDLIEVGVQAFRVSALVSSAPKLVFNQVNSEVAPESRRTSKLAGDESTPVHQPKRVEKTQVLDALKADDLTALLTSKAETLFDPKRKKSDATSAKAPTAKAARKRSGFFYYVLIACIAIIGISAAMMVVAPPKTQPAPSGDGVLSTGAFSLQFERDIVSRDNVFRFALLLENGALQFSVDDLKSQRHVNRTEKVSPETVEMLRTRIGNSGLWTEPPSIPSPGAETTQIRKIMVADGKRVKELTYVGSYAPTCFGIVESIIDDLAETYGVQTISLSPEELRRMAESNFSRAEDLYDNRDAKGSNLRESIRRYRVVVGSLEQFMPRPVLWEQAKKRLDEAESLRALKLNNLEMERIRVGQLNDLDSLRMIFLQVMEISDEDSPEYYAARERLFKLDSMTRGRKR